MSNKVYTIRDMGPGTYLAEVKDVRRIEVVDVELFGYIGDHLVDFAFDFVRDLVEGWRGGLRGIECCPAEHGRIEL